MVKGQVLLVNLAMGCADSGLIPALSVLVLTGHALFRTGRQENASGHIQFEGKLPRPTPVRLHAAGLRAPHAHGAQEGC